METVFSYLEGSDGKPRNQHRLPKLRLPSLPRTQQPRRQRADRRRLRLLRRLPERRRLRRRGLRRNDRPLHDCRGGGDVRSDRFRSAGVWDGVQQ